jgi:hypothetical protein
MKEIFAVSRSGNEGNGANKHKGGNAVSASGTRPNEAGAGAERAKTGIAELAAIPEIYGTLLNKAVDIRRVSD